MFFIPYGTTEDQPRQHFPVVTLTLVAINVLVFLYEMSLLLNGNGNSSALDNFLTRYAVIPSQFTSGHLLQIGLLTSMFLHAGFLHIAGNMLYLLPFGDNVEDRLGKVRYVVFYLACGVIAALTFILFNQHTNAPLLGASGAIAGVLGGYLALQPRGKVKGVFFLIIIPFLIRFPAWIFIVYWFVIQLFSSVASIGGAGESGSMTVAFVAHVGGFLAGLLLAPLLAATVKDQSGHQRTTANTPFVR